MIEENNFTLEEIKRCIVTDRVIKNAENCRTIGINNHAFWVDGDLRYNRANVWYYSDDFDELLRENNIDIKNESNVKKLFCKEKENLKHLSWKIVGYY